MTCEKCEGCDWLKQCDRCPRKYCELDVTLGKHCPVCEALMDAGIY